jgi:hypothetical protein
MKEMQRVGLKHWLLLGTGGLLGLLAIFLTPLAYLVKLLVAFIHEVGHSIVGWVFGYPSVPTIDFLYGGGVTIQWTRLWWISAAVFLLLGYLIYRYRHNMAAVFSLAAVTVLYAVLSLTPAHQATVLIAGHLAELVFAGLLIYRVMQGMGVPKSLEKAFLAAFVLLEDVKFSYLLVTSAAVRQDYEGSTAIGFKMDFARLASDYLHVDIKVIALSFLFCSLITPIVTYLLFRYRRRVVQPLMTRLARR